MLSDERILGSDSFVRDVLKDAEDRMEIPLTSDERLRFQISSALAGFLLPKHS
ncbi:hypothetical protein [Chlorobium limicola]